MCLFYLYATARSEIQICSNKHETGLVFTSIFRVRKFDKTRFKGILW